MHNSTRVRLTMLGKIRAGMNEIDARCPAHRAPSFMPLPCINTESWPRPTLYRFFDLAWFQRQRIRHLDLGRFLKEVTGDSPPLLGGIVGGHTLRTDRQ